jgi:hypothetical protein
MRKLYVIFSVFIIGFTSSDCWIFAQPDKGKEPFSLTVQSSSSNYKIGSEIRLDIIVTNTSESTIGLQTGPGVRMAERHFNVVAVGPDGTVAKETPYGLHVHGKDNKGSISAPGSRYVEEIPAGKQIHQEIDISKMYDLTSSGTYSIYVTRDYELDKHMIVKSNRIQLTLVR